MVCWERQAVLTKVNFITLVFIVSDMGVFQPGIGYIQISWGLALFLLPPLLSPCPKNVFCEFRTHTMFQGIASFQLSNIVVLYLYKNIKTPSAGKRKTDTSRTKTDSSPRNLRTKNASTLINRALPSRRKKIRINDLIEQHQVL